jgi:hypothetical protein
MIDHRQNMSCEEFSACMVALIAAGEDVFAHPHVRKCKLHRALLDDLEAIARVAKQMFPDLDPPDAVWDQIETRIANGHCPDPIVAHPWPGTEVVVSLRVIEHGSPPRLNRSSSQDKPSLGWHVVGAPRAFPRREGP